MIDSFDLIFQTCPFVKQRKKAANEWFVTCNRRPPSNAHSPLLRPPLLPRDIYLICANISITAYHFTTFVFNLLLITSIIQLALNPFLPRLHPLLSQTPIGYFYPTKISLPPSVTVESYVSQVVSVILSHGDRSEFLRHLRLCVLLGCLGYAGSFFKALLPESITDDFSHLRTAGGGRGSMVRQYSRFMMVATRAVLGLVVAPKIMSHPYFAASPFVPYVFLVSFLNSLCCASSAAYSSYTSFDSYFVPSLFIRSKTFCDLFLLPLASSQEAVVMVYGVFLPAPPHHNVTWEKLMVSAAVLFYYVPAPFLLFNDGWEERTRVYDKFGDLSEERKREIEEMVTRADPAYKKFEKKFRKRQIELNRGRVRVRGLKEE